MLGQRLFTEKVVILPIYSGPWSEAVDNFLAPFPMTSPISSFRRPLVSPGTTVKGF